MPSLKDIIRADVSKILNSGGFAEPVTYGIHETGAVKAINAIIDVTADLAATPQGKGITGTATINAADITRPAVYDTLTTASGQIWRVEAITRGDGFSWDLFITSDNRPVVG